jgi:Cu/Ag efflux protein CusF
MIARLYRPLLMVLLPLALVSCVSPAPTVAEEGAAVPLGVDLGGSGPVIASPPAPAPALHAGDHPSSSPHGGVQIAHAGDNDAHGTGTVNSVDPARHKVNISHQPIPEIGWPAMTMEFPAAPSVDLTAIKPGTRVNFAIERQPGGMYEIKSIAPAGGGR